MFEYYFGEYTDEYWVANSGGGGHWDPLPPPSQFHNNRTNNIVST